MESFEDWRLPATGVRVTARPRTVEAFVERNGAALLALARRFSATGADADDAYQRAMEVLLTKAPDAGEKQLTAWMATVIRNEALQIHRRRRTAANEPLEHVEAALSDDSPDPSDLVVERERFGRRREALRRLSPQHARCLLLRADGMEYSEIGEVTGLSYTKVARYLVEGRKALRATTSSIELGHECERLLPVLSLIADDSARDEQSRDAALHLDSCRSCRATLRAFCAAPRRVSAAFPLGGLAAGGGGRLQQLSDGFGSFVTSVQERLSGHVASQPAVELLTAKKVVAVTTAVAALTAGGATVQHVKSDGGGDRPRETRPLDERSTPVEPARSAEDESRDREAAPRQVTPADLDDPAFGEDAGDERTPDRVEADPPPRPVERAPTQSPALTDPVLTEEDAAPTVPDPGSQTDPGAGP